MLSSAAGCMKTSSVSASREKQVVFTVCLALAVIVFLVFGKTCQYEFVNYDDDHHVYANPAVMDGLTLEGLARVFKLGDSDYWHPLDFVSHMLDCELYGLNPGGHHLSNVLLHASVAITLFLMLRRMTATLWPSAFIAAVFAIHPLRVESVAWISERKDLLHGLFFVLTIWAYINYARNSWSLARYLSVVILFALGLMSKPTLMPLPLLLLLLDYWPLKRLRLKTPLTTLTPDVTGAGVTQKFHRLLIEKIPLLLLAMLSCWEAARGNSSAFESNAAIPLSLRVANAVVAYATYFWQMAWPTHLAVLYPFPVDGLGVCKVAVSLLLLAAVSAGAFLWRRNRPWVLVGWGWYLVMLLPMVGIVQAGSQARADRYTYLPQIGLYLMVTWTIWEISLSWRYRRQVLVGTGLACIAALMVAAAIQTSYWRNSEALWTRALDCTSRNAIAHNNLGVAFAERGRHKEAIGHYQRALEIRPDYAETMNNLGAALAAEKQTAEAVATYLRAIELRPEYAEAHGNLGIALAGEGRLDEAADHLERAIQFKPDYGRAHYNFALVLTAQGRFTDATKHFERAVIEMPEYADAHANLGAVLVKRGFADESRLHFQKAVELAPGFVEAHYNLAVVSLAQGQLRDASNHLHRVIVLSPDFIEARLKFAELLALNGSRAAAASQLREVLRLNPTNDLARVRLMTLDFPISGQ